MLCLLLLCLGERINESNFFLKLGKGYVHQFELNGVLKEQTHRKCAPELKVKKESGYCFGELIVATDALFSFGCVMKERKTTMSPQKRQKGTKRIGIRNKNVPGKGGRWAQKEKGKKSLCKVKVRK